MRIAVFPFNSAEGVPPAVGRQLAHFAGESVRGLEGIEVNTVNLLANLQDQQGRVAFVNLGDALFEPEQVATFFEQSQADVILDGLIKKAGEGYDLTYRFHKKGQEPASTNTTFTVQELYPTLLRMVKGLAEQLNATLPEDMQGDTLPMGTDDPTVFMKFLEGYDAVVYIQQANGAVAKEFSPEPPIKLLLECVEVDPNFEGCYRALLELCRLCAQHQIGSLEVVRDALKRAMELVPDDYRAAYTLAEIYGGLGDFSTASDLLEKAVQIEPNESALYTRLGIAQMSMNMPVNAERNFRKALELEGEDKPSADFLAEVLARTDRAHEIPALWKERIDADPQNAVFHTKYAMALGQAGRVDDAIKVFEDGISSLEDAAFLKRHYARILAQREELDRAMDFFEDWLDENPTDVEAMMEYADTLRRADREFEVPDVLKNILATNPEPDVKAHAVAQLIELEQPKRAEAVTNAWTKLEKEDFEGAIQDLKPLRNWLADYYKMWWVLGQAYNRIQQYSEAEDALARLLNIYPGFEPAFSELNTSLSGQQRHEEAYNAMRFAAQKFTGSIGVALNLGLAAKRAGREDEAKNIASQLRQALGEDNQFKPILEEMEG
jgi:tetratricopeptide (TPR) repeat protein